MTDAAEIRVIVAAVDEAAAAHPRPLRRSRRAVAASAAAVAAGLRPGAMLDSSPGLAPAAAAALAAAINAALVGAPRLAAAHLDGCCYLLSLRPLSLAPWPIFFDGAAPRWGSADDASSLAAAAVPVAGAASAHTPLDLAALPGLPPPPPLNALLLGYPVAYHVSTPAAAATAAGGLSEGGVALTALASACAPLAAALGDAPDTVYDLAAFSVPAVLEGLEPDGLGSDWRGVWARRAAAAAAGGPWRPRVTTTSVSGVAFVL